MSLAVKIVNVLAPSVGKMMAESIVSNQCKRMNIKPDQLTSAALPQIAKGVEMGLKIFVGSSKAQEIGKQIQVMTP